MLRKDFVGNEISHMLHKCTTSTAGSALISGGVGTAGAVGIGTTGAVGAGTTGLQDL